MNLPPEDTRVARNEDLGPEPPQIPLSSSQNSNNNKPTSSTSGQYHFRWKEHPFSMMSAFLSLKEEEDFVDVTLACQSQQFTAHRVILSACSPYFRTLLKSNPCQHPIVILRDVSEQDLQSLLNFMYNGEVQIPEERLSVFLRTAETLQVQGLMDGESTRTLGTGQNIDIKSPRESRLSNSQLDQELEIGNERSNSGSPYFGHSSAKRQRVNGPEMNDDLHRRNSSPDQNNSDEMMVRKWNNERNDSRDSNGYFKAKSTESLLSQALEKNSNTLRSSLGGTESNDARGEDSASDTTSERPESLMDGMVKSSSSDITEGHRQSPATSSGNPLIPPGLEALYRQAGFPPAFFGLASGSASPGGSSLHGLGSTVPQVGLQSHAGNPNLAGKLDMMRVRATDPRPCPKCGKIYRSAHTLRTHMEDKHTICPGYRCVLCGTVAKSRNSLHSHMSRQHRGISTKDLPVVPMPAPFDAGLASRLLAKAGVKVSPNELAARASPTAPRRSDLPKLDSNLLSMQHQQFPLPASMPTNLSSSRGADLAELEEMRIRSAASPFGSNGGHSSSHSPRGLNPKDFGVLAAGGGAGLAGAAAAANQAGMGSALLDTYLSMIAAAGGDSNAMAAALNFQNSASRAAAFAAAAAAAAAGGNDMVTPSHPANGDGKDSDMEERGEMAMTGELGSDAENEDEMSDSEEAGGVKKDHHHHHHHHPREHDIVQGKMDVGQSPGMKEGILSGGAADGPMSTAAN